MGEGQVRDGDVCSGINDRPPSLPSSLSHKEEGSSMKPKLNVEPKPSILRETLFLALKQAGALILQKF